jgi:hypothetical protein
MTKHDRKWNRQYEQLVEYKRKKGHCMVPSRYEHDKTLGSWVTKQRTSHKNNKLRLDRKGILDEIGFAWRKDDVDDGTFKPNDKLWHQQYEKLVEYERKNGHCRVPQKKHKDDKSLELWVKKQRAVRTNNKMLPDRKALLDALNFVWKADSLATRPSTANVRGLAI